MKINKEKIILTATLASYWIAIFVATHIPVPRWTRQMGVSDKSMHFAAYMTLTFLLFFCLNFKNRADWKKFQPYLIISIVLIYAVADEFLQRFIGRNFDRLDLLADMAGIAAAMIAVTVLRPVHAVMIPVTVSVLFIPAFVKSGVLKQGTLWEIAGYAAGFAFITAAWFVYFRQIFGLDFRKLRFLFIPPAFSICTVFAVRIYAFCTNKPLGNDAMLTAFAAVAATSFLCFLIFRGTLKPKHIERVSDQNHLP